MLSADRRAALRAGGTVLWAAVPALSLGLAAPFPFVIAATRDRRRAYLVAAVVYGALTVAYWLLRSLAARAGSPVGVATSFLMLALMVAATTHAFAIRPRVFPPAEPASTPVAAARRNIEARARARRIVAGDPVLADELRIGRPDLGRTFDDGGLVDANHVPASTLRQVPWIDDALAARIVATRGQVGGFDSLADLEVVLGLEPQVLDRAADLLLFRR